MKLHHVGVRVGQRESRSDTASRTDRAEQISVVVSLVSRLCGPGPLANEAVLLADPGLVLEPYLDRCRLGQTVEMSLQRAWEIFLNASTIR